MKLDALAKALSNPEQVGLTPAIAKKLGLSSEDATRGRLMAQLEADRSHLGVYLLAAFVVDDTDFWGDGEVYYWCIPTMVNKAGQVQKDPLNGLPSGAAPHKVGSLEWMTNISMKTPPLLAVIPPDDDVDACVFRLAFYDDDGKPADINIAMEAGLEAYANVPSANPLPGPEHIINPVRDAIWQGLKAEQDDILIDQDITIRRGATLPFNSGMIGSVMNSFIHLYYFVKDENRTETFGPVALHKGQTETIKFDQNIESGGRISIFSRGANVSCSTFGELTGETPFQNRVIGRSQVDALKDGFTVTATGPAKFIAYYTPPEPHA